MDQDETHGTGALHRLDGDGSVHMMDDGYIAANHLAFSADARILHESDTFERATYAFDVDADGSLANHRVFARFED